MEESKKPIKIFATDQEAIDYLIHVGKNESKLVDDTEVLSIGIKAVYVSGKNEIIMSFQASLPESRTIKNQIFNGMLTRIAEISKESRQPKIFGIIEKILNKKENEQ